MKPIISILHSSFLLLHSILEVFRMSKTLLRTFCILGIVAFLLSCGDVRKPDGPEREEKAAIIEVLNDQWRKGYVTQDVDLYISAFWEDGFLYESDYGTDLDPSDDIIFKDIGDERASAIKIFERFQTIELEITEPPDITILNEERSKAEVRNHYKIAFTVADGTSIEGGYTGYYAEGDSIFTFELRKGEWRITKWKDEAFTKEEIEEANDMG